jgi:GNAT superfamily N-acetyltransferase
MNRSWCVAGSRGCGDTGLVGIRQARAEDLPDVQRIDRDAGHMFGEVGMPDNAGFLWSLEALCTCLDAGRLWVITESDDRPAGFLITDMVDGCLHVAQVSGDPGSARRGLGRALLDYAAELAAAAGLPAVTLTTFAEVPWNALYYLRCGFRLIDDAKVTPGLGSIRQREDVVLHRWPRGLHAPRSCAP